MTGDRVAVTDGAHVLEAGEQSAAPMPWLRADSMTPMGGVDEAADGGVVAGEAEIPVWKRRSGALARQRSLCSMRER